MTRDPILQALRDEIAALRQLLARAAHDSAALQGEYEAIVRAVGDPTALAPTTGPADRDATAPF